MAKIETTMPIARSVPHPRLTSPNGRGSILVVRPFDQAHLNTKHYGTRKNMFEMRRH